MARAARPLPVGLAEDEDGDIGVGDGVDLFKGGLERRALTHELIEAMRLAELGFERVDAVLLVVGGDGQFDGDGLGIVEVAVDRFDIEGVVAGVEVVVFDPARVGSLPGRVPAVELVDIGHPPGMGGEAGAVEFEGLSTHR
jgi:hypothetical protein